MDKKILEKINKEIRKLRPILDSNTVCYAFRNNTFLEIAFMSKRCKNDIAGSCIMCDYGAVNTVKNMEVYLKEMIAILQKEQGIQYLLLCTNGSFMDFTQIPEMTFCKILKYINKTDIPNVIIETHYLDVTIEKLQLIKQLLCSKNVTLELGMETVNQYYQDLLIMKHIDMKVFEKTIVTIQNHGFFVDLNILFGLPFLSEIEQFNDTKKSITWAFEHNCNVIIFPINIKPYTLLMNMYENGYYKPVSHWLLLLLLQTIKTEQLSKITISYYGNRDDKFYGKEHKTVFPDCCSICKKPLFNFYDSFSKEDNPHQKKELLNHILKFRKCSCLRKQEKRLVVSSKQTFEERYQSYSDFLKNKYNFMV